MTVAVPEVEEVATLLGRKPEEIESTYLAEVTAQARACRVDPYSSDLAGALVRRVARSLDMRNLPLGVKIDELGSFRVGTFDPEVRRLEGPYRKAPVG